MEKNDTKYLIGFLIVIVFLIVGGVMLFSKNPPTTEPVKITETDLVSKTSRILGSKNAKVNIVEFSDFECPACGTAHPIVKQVLEKNKDNIRFIYRHFPLPQHPYSQKAAEAAEAAGAQGKYWEMHDLLFENQKSLTEEDLLKYAKDLKLDTDQFKKDIDSGKYKSIVDEDLAAGQKIGIDATPTFFINGVKLTVPPTLENFQKEIEKELEKIK